VTPQKPFYASPQDVEAAFYDAIEKADLEAMMAVWAEDEEIVCIHPGGALLVGYMAVRESWRRVFEKGARLEVRVTQQARVQGPFTAVHSLIEQVANAGDRGPRAPLAATNVYARGALGWRLLVHHASPVPPDSLGEGPKTLH
jgi:uncharacterized protein (TIGR02246 family)